MSGDPALKIFTLAILIQSPDALGMFLSGQGIQNRQVSYGQRLRPQACCKTRWTDIILSNVLFQSTMYTTVSNVYVNRDALATNIDYYQQRSGFANYHHSAELSLCMIIPFDPHLTQPKALLHPELKSQFFKMTNSGPVLDGY